MKKRHTLRVISVLLTAVMLLGMASVAASAVPVPMKIYDFPTPEENPNDIRPLDDAEDFVKRDDISGYSMLGDGTYKLLYDDSIAFGKSIIVPGTCNGVPVTVIGANAYYNKNMKHVTISDSITSIEDYAFAQCSMLSSVIIPDSVKKLGKNVFEGSDNVTLYVVDGSAAQSYAIENKIPYQTQVDIATCYVYYDFIYPDKAYVDVKTPEGLMLRKDIDYTAESVFDWDTCDAVLTVKGKGLYTGEVVKTGHLFRKDLAVIENAFFELDNTSYIYDGTEKKPKVSLYQRCETPRPIDDDNGSIPFYDDDDDMPTDPPATHAQDNNPTYTDYYFTEGEDYVVSYKNNVDIGTATVTVTGIKRYQGTLTRNFTITGKTLSGASVKLSSSSYTYDGYAKTPDVTVTLNGKQLSQDKDYTVSYQNNVNAGTATAVISGKGNYGGSVSKTFNISKASLANAAATLSESEFTYDGTAKRPEIILVCNGKTLASGTDYTLSYSNNTNVGTATVTATGKGNYTGSKQKSFTIKQDIRSVSDCEITLSAGSYVYDGTAKKPGVTVKYKGTELTAGTDYTVAYSNNINAGKGTVTITGKGTYSGSKSLNFTINRKAITASMVSRQSGTNYYTGYSVPFRFTISDGGKAMTENTDYMVFCHNCTDAGTANADIEGIGNYKGTLTFDYTISPVSVANVNAKLSETSFKYDGNAKTPVIKSAYISSANDPYAYILKEGTDYTLSYKNNVNPGTATVTLNGKGNYTGSKSFNYTINGIDASKFTLDLSPGGFTYTGAAQSPSVTVHYGATVLTSGTDYSVSYKNNVNAGAATVTVTGKGVYTGSISKNYTIWTRHISDASPKLSATSYNYDGKAKTPALTLTYNGKSLTQGTDYTVSYQNNKAPGKATVTYTGIGNWRGIESVTFEIKKVITPFTWGVDNWNFDNEAQYFNINNSPNPASFVEAYIKPSIKNTFIKQLNLNSTAVNDLNEAIIVQNKPVTDDPKTSGRGGWHGSCYGMTMTEMLVKYGYLDLTTYGGDPVVHNNTANNDIISMINCYQYTQSSDAFNSLIRRNAFNNDEYISNSEQTQFLKGIEERIKKGRMANICFTLYTKYLMDYGKYKAGDENDGGHSVLGYRIENCSWTSDVTGITYDRKVLIADPNNLKDNYEGADGFDDYCMYYKSDYSAWIMRAYTCTLGYNLDSGFLPVIERRSYWTKNAYSDWSSNGYLNDAYDYDEEGKLYSLTNSSDPDRYIAGLSVNSATGEEAAVTQLTENCNTSIMYANENDTTGVAKYQDYSVTESGDPQPGENFALWNPTASYTLRYDNKTAMSLAMDYRDVNYYADLSNSDYVKFSPEGNITAEGDNTSYSLSMVTSDNESVTDWTKLTVEGSGVDTVNLKKTYGGYLLTADSLQNVTVKADNASADTQTTFSTAAGTVYIYEIDENTIGILADSDGNGTFETDLAGDNGFILGDVNSDGKVTIDDATFMQRFLCEFLNSDNRPLIEVADIKMFAQADVTRDGKLNIRDITKIQRFLAHVLNKL